MVDGVSFQFLLLLTLLSGLAGAVGGWWLGRATRKTVDVNARLDDQVLPSTSLTNPILPNDYAELLKWEAFSGEKVDSILREKPSHRKISHQKNSHQKTSPPQEWITDQQTLEAVVEATAVGIWEWNIDTGETIFNTRWAEIIGYTPEELTPANIETWIKHCHADDLEVSEAKLKAHWAGTTEMYVCEARMHHKEGHLVWVLDTGRVVEWNDDGSPHRMVGTHLDITEQKQIQNEINKLSRITRETKNGVIVASANGLVEWVNEGFTRITGYTLEEIRGKKPGNVLQGPETDIETRHMIAKALKNAEPFSAEILNYRKDGTPYWVAIECSPLKDEDGRLQGFMAIESDITEKKASENRIREQAQALEQMSEHGRIGAWSLDLRANEIYWSPMTKVIHEVDPNYQPSLDAGISFYKEGESRNLIRSLVQRGINEGISWSRELEIVTAKGKTIWVIATGQPEFEQGKCVRLFGSFQDINERKRHQIQNQRALVLSQTLAGLIVHPDVMQGEIQVAASQIVKASCKALEVDRAAVWRFNESGKRLVSESIYFASDDRFHPGYQLECDDRGEFYDSLAAKAFISADNAKQEHLLQCLNGCYFEPNRIQSCLYAHISGGTRLGGMIAFESVHLARDWSSAEQSFVFSVATLLGNVYERYERKKIEQQLREAIVAANSAVAAKSAFLASMSHEIRTPMNAILGMLRLVLKQPLDLEQTRKLEVAQKSARSLLDIINDILDFSKIEAQKCELESIPFNLRVLLSDLVDSLSYEAKSKGIELVLGIHGVRHNFVVGDPGRFRQIVTNLIGNAIKFTHQGRVTVKFKTEVDVEGRLHIVGHIIDTGIGIPHAKLRSLFEAFTQVDSSTTRKYGGTGLGLSIVKGLCESMGGGVIVKSKEGHGSTFMFSVVMAQDYNSVLTLPSVSLQGRNVFLIGAFDAQALAAPLLDRVCFVDHAQGYAEFTDFLTSHHKLPDVVVIANHFDEASPFSMGRQAKEKYPNTHTVLMLDDAQPGDAIKAAERGFAGFIPTSVTPEEFLRVIEVLIDGSLLPYAKPIVTRHFVMGLQREDGQGEVVDLRQIKIDQTRILLVEDSPINQEVALDTLLDMGLTADVANNGREALEILSADETCYSLILMDCQMPVMDGFAATAAIKAGKAGERHKKTPVIALTANAIEGDREACLAAGFDDYISKPVDPDHLQYTIVKWLSTEGADTESLAAGSSNAKSQNKNSEPHPNSESALSKNNTVLKNNTVWDLAAVKRRVRGREDRLIKLINSYQAQQTDWMMEVHAQVANEDLGNAAKICHTLKGVAGNLGGVELMNTAQLLELTCKEQDVAKARKLLAELTRCNARFVELLAGYQQSHHS